MKSNPHRRTLKRLMRENALTCPDVARIVGRHVNTVRRWHAGLVRTPLHSVAYLDQRCRQSGAR